MKNIAILSGKGGTGKTLLAVNLAAVAEAVNYLDCDVEEPNGHLFFKPQMTQETTITVKTPVVDTTRCTGCRQCMDFCQFNAIACIADKAVVFPDVCHPCGGCALVCPQHAITEADRPIGKIQQGRTRQVTMLSGILNMGEESGVPVIRAMLKMQKQLPDGLTIIDCPPGSACVVMESILEADFCILVAEPTIFGVHNLDMIYSLVQLFQKPFGVILNKCYGDPNPAEAYCRSKGLPILGTIPFAHKLGQFSSNAQVAAWSDASYHRMFSALLRQIQEVAGDEAAIGFKR